MKRTANKDASKLVTNTEPFKGNNTFAEWINDKYYVVYSYGYHFPMYVYDNSDNMWYANSDKYSPTTSKHQTQLRPSPAIKKEKTTKELLSMIN